MAVVGSAEFELRAKRDQLARDLRDGERQVKATLDRQEQDAERRLTRIQRKSQGRAASAVGDAIGRIATGASPGQVALDKAPAILEGIAASGGRASASMIGVSAALTGVAAGVVLVASAWKKGESDALAFERAASGVGRTAGLTGDQLEALTIAAADQGEVSVKAARDMAAAYLSTGQIGGEAISRLIALGRDYASFMGVDAAEATKQLAKAMLDPQKAGQDLTLQFGLLTQEQLKQIDAMVEQGDLMGAQAVLYNELGRAVEGHADKLGTIESAWDAIARSISNAIDAAGRYFYTTEGERLQQIIDRRASIERGQRQNGRPLDAKTQGIYDTLGREGAGILASRRARAAAAAQATANQAAERERRRRENLPAARTSAGRSPQAALSRDNEQTLRDLAARREALTIEGQIAVLKAQGRDAEAAAAQRRLDVLNLTRTYEAAGFEQAKELAEAQGAAMANAETRQRAIVNGQQEANRWLELAIDGQRQSADLALERARYEAQIAGLRGDPRAIEQAERDLYIQERINDLLRDKVGLITAADLAAATAQATSEADDLGSADREGRLRDEFRRSFVDGMRAAIDGDVGGLFDSLADRFTDRLLESLADDLFDLLKDGESGGFLGSIFGGLKGLIPGFASGVSNYGGGLAYVHQGEVLANLSKGTSVIPAHAVRAMGAMAGSMGGAGSAPALVRVLVESNDEKFAAFVDERVLPAAAATYAAGKADQQRAVRAAPYRRRG